MLSAEDLIIATWLELRVGLGMLGADDVAEVTDVPTCTLFGGEECVGGLHLWMDVEQLAHQHGDVVIEIDKELPFALKERREVVGIEFEERRLAVGTADGIPVQVAPVAMVADTCVAGEAARDIVGHGYGECLYAVRGGDAASVAVGLLHEVVVLLYPYLMVTVEFLVQLHGTEVGCGYKALREAPLRRLRRRGVAGCRGRKVVVHLVT